MIRFLIRLMARSRGSSAVSGVVFSTAALTVYDMITSRTGRQELVDVSDLKPGETIMITSLDVSHKEQIKEEKRSAKKAKGSAKVQAKAAKAEAKAAKAEAKALRSEARAARAQARKARRSQRRAANHSTS